MMARQLERERKEKKGEGKQPPPSSIPTSNAPKEKKREKGRPILSSKR